MGTSAPWITVGWTPPPAAASDAGHWRASAELAGIPWERWEEVLTRSGVAGAAWAHTAYSAPSAANLAKLYAGAIASGVSTSRIDLFLARVAAATAADYGVHSVTFT